MKTSQNKIIYLVSFLYFTKVRNIVLFQSFSENYCKQTAFRFILVTFRSYLVGLCEEVPFRDFSIRGYNGIRLYELIFAIQEENDKKYVRQQ